MIEQQTNRIYDYWQWPNLFNHKELVEMHDLFNKYHVQNAIDSPAKGKTKLVNLKMTHWGYFKSKLQPLEQRILKCNQDYFGYSLFPQYDDNMIMLNEYDSKQKGEYDWHTDGSGNPRFFITNAGTNYASGNTISFTDPGSTSNTAVLTVNSIVASSTGKSEVECREIPAALIGRATPGSGWQEEDQRGSPQGCEGSNRRIFPRG